MVELKTYSEELFNRILYATESNSTFSEEEFFNLTSELIHNKCFCKAKSAARRESSEIK